MVTTASPLTKQRSAYLDNLKGVLIFLVILAHLADIAHGQMLDPFLQAAELAGMKSGEIQNEVFFPLLKSSGHLCRSLFTMMYTFHMPLFIFLNGCLSRKIVQSKKRVVTSMLYYFVLYVLLKAANLVANAISGQALAFALWSEGGVPWYLFSLGSFYGLTWLLRRFPPRVLLPFAVVVSLLCGYDSSVGDLLCMSRTIVFYPFFLAGLSCGPGLPEQINRKHWLKAIAAPALIGFAYLCWREIDLLYYFRPLFTGRNSYRSLEILTAYGPLLRLALYGVAVLVSICVMALVPRRRCFLTTAGSRSLALYFWHRPAIYLMTGLGLLRALQAAFGEYRMRTIILWLGFSVVMFFLFSWKPFSAPFQKIKDTIDRAYADFE